MLQIILLALSFLCISNIQAAQDSKAVAEDHTEVAIPTATSLVPTAPQTSTPHAPGPWQTLAHSRLPAPLWPLIFGYARESRNRWTIINESGSSHSIFLSKNERSLYIGKDDLTRYDMDTGMLQSQSPVDAIKPGKKSALPRSAEYFPMDGDRVIVDMGSWDDIRSVDTRSIPKETREHHILPKRVRSLCSFNGYLVTPNDLGVLEMRNPITLESQPEIFFQCNPGPKELDFEFLHSVGDRFLFAGYTNHWKKDWTNLTMEVFDKAASPPSQTSICSLPWPGGYHERPKTVERISANRFVVMACNSKVLKILNTKKKNVVAISRSYETISSFAKFGKNKLLTGGDRGTIALWAPRKKTMVNNSEGRIISLVRLNNNEFLSMDHMQCIKLWNAKEGMCTLQLQDQKEIPVDKFISLSDGYIIHDINGIRRLQITNELQSAYEAESESHADEPRKAKVRQPTRAKKAACTSRPSPGSSSTPQRRRSLSPARPAAMTAAAAAAAPFSFPAAAGVAPVVKKIAL